MALAPGPWALNNSHGSGPWSLAHIFGHALAKGKRKRERHCKRNKQKISLLGLARIARVFLNN